MRTRPVLSWLTPLLLAACGGDAASTRPCDRLGLLCSDDTRTHSLALDDSRSVSADLDEDGELDLVTAGGSAGLSIAWSTTDLRDYRLFPGPVPDARIGDLDRDGHLDIVLVTSDPPALHILAGTGTREFTDGPTQTLAGHPRSLWLGPLDADDSLDAVVASADDGTLTILTDDLTRARPIVVGRDLAVVDVGDLNNDGRLDLVALDQADAAFYVVLASGDDFAAPRRVATGLAPAYLQILDHDGDGKLDVLTHGKGPEIWFHHGDGTGGFAPARPLLIQTEASQGFGAHRDEMGRRWLLTVADGNLTAHELDDADQVIGRVRAGSLLEFTGLTMHAGAPILRGAWYGGRYSLAPAPIFSERWHVDIDDEHPTPVFGDLDLDGTPELVTAEHDTIVLRRQLSTTSWTEIARLDIGEDYPSLAIGDVTGDGLPDLVITDSAPALRVAIGDGDGNLTLGPITPLPAEPHDVYAGLVPPGGGPPLVIVASHDNEQRGIHAFHIDAAGNAIAQPQPLTDDNAAQLAVADIDGDGGEDLVTLVRAADDSLSLVIIPSTADGWGPPRSRPLAAVLPDLRSSATLVLGDLDLDDTVDAVLVGRGSSARLMNIGSDLPLAPLIDEVENDGDAVGIADLNDDGRPDLAMCSPAGVRIALTTPENTLAPQPPHDSFFYRCALHVTADGTQTHAAIVDHGGISLLTPDFAPALAQEASFRGGPSSLGHLATGDIDADGHIDIIVATIEPLPTVSLAVLWGDGDGRPQRATWTDGWLFNPVTLAVGPLDDQPGDEIVALYSNGDIEVYTHAEGSLETQLFTQLSDLHRSVAVGLQRRASGGSDLIVRASPDNDAWHLVALPYDASGAFVDPGVPLWTSPGAASPLLEIADFDADGNDDIVAFPPGSTEMQVLWGNEQRIPVIDAIPTAPEILPLDHADMNNDGVPELIVGGIEGVLSYSLAGRVVAPPITHIRSEPIQGLLIADLEADGHADILRTDDNLLNVTLRNAAGNEYVQLPFDPPWQQLHAADLDRDGILDLLGLQDGELVTRLSAPQPAEAP